MRYGILTYEELKNKFNIGDYIQSLAAKQYLPRVDEYINREKGSEYSGETLKLIMNGWFTHTTTNEWIPSKDIKPLLVSFHLNNSSIPFMLNDEGVNFFKSVEPIGCRDQFTAQTLQKHGVDAFYTGCLTLTLDNYKVDDSERNDKIYIVDPFYNYPKKDDVFSSLKSFVKGILDKKIFNLERKNNHLKKIFTQELLDKAEYINHDYKGNMFSIDEKFQMADNLLKKYSKAKLVITSRIHCALPCLAMGTPVIYLNGFDDFFDSCRFDGIIEYFNRVDVNPKTGSFTSSFPFQNKIGIDITVKNPEAYLSRQTELKNICKNYIPQNR
ncbi:polysaccharide pyruvyl transferase family protein [Chryseobacterium sp.]|uniref:polysaccharide pyruvyl transferase family protein n=1 Tax=Chryseobacterium sp. TaxID=1871047 RepID=UPI002FCB66BA